MDNTFGKKLKKIRNERKLSLERLALDLHTTKTTLSRYENGIRNPKAEFIKCISDYFKVPVNYFYENDSFIRYEFEIIDKENLPKELKEIDPDMAIQMVADNNGLSADDIKSIIEAAKKIKANMESKK